MDRSALTFRFPLPIEMPIKQALIPALRLTQVVSGLIAFITALAGDSNCTFSSSKSSINFLVANGVLVVVFVSAWAYAVERKGLVKFPHPYVPLGFDFIWLIFAFAGGIAGATSDLVADVCGEESFRTAFESTCGLNCGALRTAVAFTFFIFFASLAVMGLTWQKLSSETVNEEAEGGEYQAEKTPTVSSQSTTL